MPVHVVFVRHAESANNKRGTNDTRACDRGSETVDERTGAPSAKGRVADPALTERGSRQAEVTARYLAGLSERGVWTVRKLMISPMLRTLHTARPIMKTQLGRADVTIDSRLHEEGGLFQGPRARRGADEDLVFGLNRREAFNELKCDRCFDDVHWIGTGKSDLGGWWTGGFEEEAATRARARDVAEALWDAAEEIEREHAGEDNSAIVVVSHGLFLDSVYCELLGIPNNDERSSFFMTTNCSVTPIYQLNSVRAILLEDLGLTRSGWSYLEFLHRNTLRYSALLMFLRNHTFFVAELKTFGRHTCEVAAEKCPHWGSNRQPFEGDAAVGCASTRTARKLSTSGLRPVNCEPLLCTWIHLNIWKRTAS